MKTCTTFGFVVIFLTICQTLGNTVGTSDDQIDQNNNKNDNPVELGTLCVKQEQFQRQMYHTVLMGFIPVKDSPPYQISITKITTAIIDMCAPDRASFFNHIENSDSNAGYHTSVQNVTKELKQILRVLDHQTMELSSFQHTVLEQFQLESRQIQHVVDDFQ